MGARTIVSGLVLVVLAALGWWWFSGGGVRGDPSPASQGVVQRVARQVSHGVVEPAPREPTALTPDALTAGSLTPAALAGAGGAPSAADETTPDADPRLTGRVLTHEGAPLPGARVYYLPNLATAKERGLEVQRLPVAARADLPQGITDAAGRFDIPAPHDGTDNPLGPEAMLARMFPPEVVAGAAGFTWVSRRLPEHQGGDRDVGDIVLDPAATLFGRVLDPLGRPLPDTVVGPFPWMAAKPASRADDDPLSSQAAGRAWAFWRTVTDAGGRFVLDRVVPGRGRIGLAHPLYRARDTDEIELGPGATRDLGDLALDEAGVLAGVVLDGARRPVEGAHLRLTEDESSSRELSAARRLRSLLIAEPLEARSDARGAFLFSGLSSVLGDLTVTATGYDQQRLAGVAVGRTDVVVTLEAGRWMLVDVRDGAGQPVAEAVVEARYWSGRGLRQGGTREVRSGAAVRALLHEAGLAEPGSGATGLAAAAGLAAVSLPPRGELELIVTAVGRAGHRERLPIEGWTPFGRHTVVLAPEGRLAGRVLDTAGEPVAGAAVVAVPPGSTGASGAGGSGGQDDDLRLPGEAACDEQGRFDLGGLAGGDWTLVAAATGYVDSAPHTVALAPGGRVDDLQLVLADGGTLLVRVFARDGSRPVAHKVTVWQVRPDGVTADWRHSETGPEGDARLSALPAGVWHLRADPGAFDEAEVVVGQVTEVVLQLRALPRVSGVVREAGGRPVPQAWVSISKIESRGDEPFRARMGGDDLTDDAGHYEIVGNWTMQGTLVAHLAGGGRSESLEVLVDWDEHRLADLWVPGGGVRGRVVDADSGAPVAGAFVRAERVGAAPSVSHGVPRRPTGIDGAFDLRGLAAGSYDLHWNAEGYARADGVAVTLAEGEIREDLELQLAHGGRLVVRVTDAAGAPVRNGTEVTMLDADTDRYLADQQTLEGAVTFDALPAGQLVIVVGNYMLSVIQPDAASTLTRVPVTLADGEERIVEVVLVP